ERVQAVEGHDLLEGPDCEIIPEGCAHPEICRGAGGPGDVLPSRERECRPSVRGRQPVHFLFHAIASFFRSFLAFAPRTKRAALIQVFADARYSPALLLPILRSV